MDNRLLGSLKKLSDEKLGLVLENEALKNNLLVIQNTNDELRDTVKSLRELAHEYIQAYESLAFEDAKETT